MTTKELTDREYLDKLAELTNSRCPRSNANAAARVSIFDRLDFDTLTDDEMADVAAMPIPSNSVGRTYWCEHVLPKLAQRLCERLAKRSKAKPTISAGKARVPKV